MKLRKLELKDIEGILEWIKDSSINCYFRFDPDSIDEKSIEEFILESHNDIKNYHFAIVDANDEYLGTISLKNIDNINKNAEYAISLRKSSIGKGISKSATEEIISFGFKDLDLNKIYLNVYSDNIRAIKFYEKMGFKYEGEFKNHIFFNGKYKSLKWYGIFKEDM